MQVRDLSVFKVLAENLHYGKSAQLCHLSPSALTRLIQKMEQELKVELFIRGSKGLVLTQAGKEFLQYAKKSLFEWDEIQRKINPENKDLRGKINLFCSVTACYSVVPEVLEVFRKSNPHISIDIETGDAARALDKLNENSVDFTIAALPKELNEKIEHRVLKVTPLVFIKPKKNKYLDTSLKNKYLDWSKVPMILPEKGLARQRIDHWFSKKNIVPSVYSQVSGNEAILAMVNLGCGVGVVPKLVVDKSPLKEGVEVITINPKLEDYQVAICVIKKRLGDSVLSNFWTCLDAYQLFEGNKK